MLSKGASSTTPTLAKTGRRKLRSIWFAQSVGLDLRIVDFHQDSQRSIRGFSNVLQGKRYVSGVDWLPHDAQSEALSSSGRSIEQIIREAARDVPIVPSTALPIRINAVRTALNNVNATPVSISGALALPAYLHRDDLKLKLTIEHGRSARMQMRKSTNTGSGSTVAQLKNDIDSGRTGDKVAASDPGLSPLGTDDEAGGAALSPASISVARRDERAIGAAAEREVPSASRAAKSVPILIMMGVIVTAAICAAVFVFTR